MDYCWSAQHYPAKKNWKWGLETYIVSRCHDDIQVGDWQLHLDQSGPRWASLTSCDRWWDQELLVGVSSSRNSNKMALQLQKLWETHACMLSQLCPTLCNPMDCNPPGSSIHGGVFKSVLLSWRSGRQKSRGRSGRPLAPTLQISMGQFMQKSVHCHTSWFFTFESFLSCCRIPLFLFNVYLAALDLSCSSQDLQSSLRHVEFLVAACKLLVAACRI